MRESFRDLRKFSGNLKYSNAGIDSRQACPEFNRRGAKHAKFGIERLIILQTILLISSDLCGLCVFAGDIPRFGCGFAAQCGLFPTLRAKRVALAHSADRSGLRQFSFEFFVDLQVFVLVLQLSAA